MMIQYICIVTENTCGAFHISSYKEFLESELNYKRDWLIHYIAFSAAKAM